MRRILIANIVPGALHRAEFFQALFPSVMKSLTLSLA